MYEQEVKAGIWVFATAHSDTPTRDIIGYSTDIRKRHHFMMTDMFSPVKGTSTWNRTLTRPTRQPRPPLSSCVSSVNQGRGSPASRTSSATTGTTTGRETSSSSSSRGPKPKGRIRINQREVRIGQEQQL